MTTHDTTFAFRPARRSNAKPLIGIYSESGCGKTYSALLLARGFVGPTGRIGMIETEAGRGEAYADKKDYPEIGGYEVLPLHDDFSPEAYGNAIGLAEKANPPFDALILDSASHEWEGQNGVLQQAAAREASGVKGQLIWQKPKIDHQRHFMLRFMQTPIPLVILCMRAKYPMEKKGNDWARSTKLEPKQSDDILFEMFVHGWIDADHKFHITRAGAKALEPVFGGGQPISLQTGEKLAAWSRGERSEDRYTQLFHDAEDVAEKGLLKLKAWWKALPGDDYLLLKDQAKRLQGIAKKADQAATDPLLSEEPDDDHVVITREELKDEYLPTRRSQLKSITDLAELMTFEAETVAALRNHPDLLAGWRADVKARADAIIKAG